MGHPGYIGQPDWDGHIEYMKSKVRCKAGHVFAVAKGKFGYRKAVYRGLKKNLARLYMLFCSANLLGRAWMTAPGVCVRPGNVRPAALKAVVWSRFALKGAAGRMQTAHGKPGKWLSCPHFLKNA
jgi:hypothetical protein